jgi:hypothetical protein
MITLVVLRIRKLLMWPARALKQLQGLPGSAFDSLIQAMADVIDYPDDPLGTFPTLGM